MKNHQKDLLRIFFAFDIDDILREQLKEIIADLKNQPAADNVKWVPAENLHVTLRFLGEVDPEKITEINNILSEEIKTIKSFDLETGRIVHFPPTGKPHVIALSFPLTMELATLIQAIERSVSRCGFIPENRPFLPHLTLGRLRFSRELNLNERSAKLPKKLSIKEIILYRSDPGEAGSIYTPVKKFKLH